MKKIMLLLILSYILSNCTFDKQRIEKGEVTLEYTNDTIYIKLGKNEVNNTFCNQFILINNHDCLALLNDNRKSICIYDFKEQKLLNEIVIKKEGNNSFPGVSTFIIKNMDSIILLSSWPQNIGLMNWKGEIIKKVSYEKDDEKKTLNPAPGSLFTMPVLIDSFIVLNQTYRMDGTAGKLTITLQKKTNVAFSVNLNNSSIKSLPLCYPIELINKDIGGMNISRVLGYNNSFVYNFSILPCLFVTQDHVKFKRFPIQTNYNLNLPENQSKYKGDLMGAIDYLLTRDDIHHIRYDKFREYYYIFVRKGCEDKKRNLNYRTKLAYPNCFIIILDKDFKHIGDVNLPEDTYSFNNIFISEKGVYISEDHVDNPSYSDDAMRFRLFKIKQIQ